MGVRRGAHCRSATAAAATAAPARQRSAAHLLVVLLTESLLQEVVAPGLMPLLLLLPPLLAPATAAPTRPVHLLQLALDRPAQHPVVLLLAARQPAEWRALKHTPARPAALHGRSKGDKHGGSGGCLEQGVEGRRRRRRRRRAVARTSCGQRLQQSAVGQILRVDLQPQQG